MKTLGADFSLYENKIDKNIITIWEIAGDDFNDDLKFLRPAFFKNNRASIIVFDLEDTEQGRESFVQIRDWHKKILQYSGDVPVLLLGNKSDLVDLTLIDEAKIQATVNQEKFIGYESTSAKTGDGVEKSFRTILKHLYNSVSAKIEEKKKKHVKI